MKYLLPLMVLLSTTVAAAAAFGPADDLWSGLANDQPHPAVVRVVVSEGQTVSLGSGTLVAVRGRHGMVVTNWHVIRDARGPINVVFPDGFRSGATLLGSDADWDLAALAVWAPQRGAGAIVAASPACHEALTIAGYGSGNYRSSSGRCVQYISPGGNHPFEMLELSASARDGDSGGPIFNAQGELAGVLFGAARGRTAGSYCGRVAWFLNSVTPRFDALSAPPADTMIAQDLPAPPATPESGGLPASQVAMGRPRRLADSAWEAGVFETSEPPAKPSRRRSMPLASIPAPVEGPEPSAASSAAEPADDASEEAAGGGPTSLGTASVPAGDSTVAAAQPLPHGTPIQWLDLLGSTRPEQARNFLAILGVVAIVFHGVKVFGAIQLQPAKRRRRPVRRRVRVWW